MKRLIDILAVLGVLWGLLAPAPGNAQSAVVPYGSGAGGPPRAVLFTPVLLNGLSTTVTSVKSNAQGKLGYTYCYNPNASVAYIQIFDAATPGAVTLGSTTPKMSLGVPATASSGLGPALIGTQFLLGIQVAVTTTATGSTAPGTAMDCNASVN